MNTMAIHPKAVLVYTPIIIIITVQVLGDLTRGSHISKGTIESKIASILVNKDDPKALVISQCLMKY